MIGIVEFIEARLVEDERIARLLERSSIGSAPTFRATDEVRARRLILELHRHTYGDYGENCATCQHPEDELASGAPWPCPTLRALASSYAGHLAYRQEWRP